MKKLLKLEMCELLDIEYKKLPYNSKSTLTIDDTINFVQESGNIVEFIFAREIGFVPESDFKLKVSFLNSYQVKKDKSIESIDWVEFIKNLDEDEVLSIGGTVFGRLSLLASNIISSDGASPMITAPVPYMKFSAENSKL